MEEIRCQCCIVGGGPAGMMAGYLLARAGISVVVIEKHKDFLRDFRGDTIHPSTLTLLHELGVLEAFLERPHQKLAQLKLSVAGTQVAVADFSKIDAVCPYIVFMPQWDFLDFIAQTAAQYATFRLLMECEAVGLIEREGRVVGVETEGAAGALNIYADLTIAADGRRSAMRGSAGLEVNHLGAPMDVLWMRVSKDPSEVGEFLGHFAQGSLMITIDRGDYWQCAFVIAKGQFEAFKALGIEHLRERMVALVPSLAKKIDELRSWDDCFLLTVAVDRLTTWWRPGLLCIGDAAHAMSPIGGVGINLAIQDAVAAANALVPAWEAPAGVDAALPKIQQRRAFATRLTQSLQVFVQNRIIGNVLQSPRAEKPPLALRVLRAWPWLQRIPARVIGLGVRQEHIHTPQR